MKLRDTVQEKVFDEVPKRKEVLNSGYTIGEIENDLDRREDAMGQIEKKVDSFADEKIHWLQKASEASPRKKIRYYARAKEAGMYKSFWSDLWENLMVQQFFLINLMLEGRRHNLLVDPGEEFNFGIDIGEMDAEAMTDALQSHDVERTEVQETMEEVNIQMNQQSSAGMTLDLNDIRAEAEELEAANMGDAGVELGANMTQAIDAKIEAELRREQQQS